MCLIVTCFSKRVTIVINDDNVKQSITIPEVKDSVRNVVKYVKPENTIPFNWNVDTVNILLNKILVSELQVFKSSGVLPPLCKLNQRVYPYG